MTKCSRFKGSFGAAESWEEDSIKGKEPKLKIYWASIPEIKLNLLFYFIVPNLTVSPRDEIPKVTELVNARTWIST